MFQSSSPSHLNGGDRQANGDALAMASQDGQKGFMLEVMRYVRDELASSRQSPRTVIPDRKRHGS